MSAETVTVRRDATAELQSDFTGRGDTVKIAGNAGAYTVSTSGAMVTVSDGSTRISLPAGESPTDLVFADARLELQLASGNNQQILLGQKDVTDATNAALPAADGGHGGLDVRALTSGRDELSGDALDNAFLARPGTVQDTDVVRGGRGFDVLRVEADSAPFSLGSELSLPEFDLSGITARPSSEAIEIAPGALEGALFRQGSIDLSGDTNPQGRNVVDVSNTTEFGRSDTRPFELTGSTGADELIGGDEADILNGGPGQDVLTGNGGEDTFVGTLDTLDQDTITDFSTGDTIRVNEVTLTELTVSTETVKTGLKLDLEGPETTAALTLENNSGTVLTEPSDDGGVVIRPGGEEFQLTSDADDVTGTALPDTIVAPSGTLQDNDTIDGKGGTDRLRLAPDGAPYTIGSGPWSALTSVERIETSANSEAIDLAFGAGLNDSGVQRIDLSGDTDNSGINTIDLTSLDLNADAVRQVVGSPGPDTVLLGTDSQFEELTRRSSFGDDRPDGLLTGSESQDTLSFRSSQDPNSKNIDLDEVEGFEVFRGSDTTDNVMLSSSGFDTIFTGDAADNVSLRDLEFSDQGELLIGENGATVPSDISLGAGPDNASRFDADSLRLDISEVTPSDLDTFDVSEFASGVQVLNFDLSWSTAPDTLTFTTNGGSVDNNTITVPVGLNGIGLYGNSSSTVGTYDFTGIDHSSAEGGLRIDTGRLTQQATLTVRGTDHADEIDSANNAREDTFRGLGGDDNLRGNGGDDELYGGDGDDELVSGQGDDELYGGKGQDFLNGREGDDVLNGGPGTDELRGMSGGDEFEVAFGQKAHDNIADFAPSEGDAIDFTGNPDVALVPNPLKVQPTYTDVVSGDLIEANSGFIVIDNSRANTRDAPGLGAGDVEAYLADIESGTGVTQVQYMFSNTADVFYLAASDGRDTAIFRVDATGGDGDADIDEAELSKVVQLQGVDNAGTLTASTLDDFTA
jgi:Ca2+-binding RTX toxin-like protein